MHLVHLHVTTSERCDGALYLSDRVKQVLEAVLTLETFHFAGGYDESYGQPVHYVAVCCMMDILVNSRIRICAITLWILGWQNA